MFALSLTINDPQLILPTQGLCSLLKLKAKPIVPTLAGGITQHRRIHVAGSESYLQPARESKNSLYPCSAPPELTDFGTPLTVGWSAIEQQTGGEVVKLVLADCRAGTPSVPYGHHRRIWSRFLRSRSVNEAIRYEADERYVRPHCQDDTSRIRRRTWLRTSLPS